MVDIVKSNNANGKRSNQLLAIVFSFLVATIVGLSVGIILINLSNATKDDATADVITPEDAENYAAEIRFKLEDDNYYIVDDAINDFAMAFDSLEGSKKVEFAIEYALFMHDYVNDFGTALAILDSVSNLVNEETEIAYYSAYVEINDDIGDYAVAAKYQNDLAQKYPDFVDTYDVYKQEKMEYE